MKRQGSNLIANVTDAVPDDSIVRQIRGQRCRVRLDGLEGERLIINVDKIVPGGKVKCDYLLITNQPLIAPIELKSGEVGASEAKRQLQAGADLAHELVEPESLRCDLKPIVFSGRINRAERNKLRAPRNYVQFRGGAYEIKAAKCGSSLVGALR